MGDDRYDRGIDSWMNVRNARELLTVFEQQEKDHQHGSKIIQTVKALMARYNLQGATMSRPAKKKRRQSRREEPVLAAMNLQAIVPPSNLS